MKVDMQERLLVSDLVYRHSDDSAAEPHLFLMVALGRPFGSTLLRYMQSAPSMIR